MSRRCQTHCVHVFAQINMKSKYIYKTYRFAYGTSIQATTQRTVNHTLHTKKANQKNEATLNDDNPSKKDVSLH